MTPEKETPTPKTVEEVLRTIWDTPMMQSEFPSLESRIQETISLITAQNQALIRQTLDPISSNER